MAADFGITIKYIYSACVVTTTKDTKILHDPWFTQGIYDGSWFQFPVVDEPIEAIGDVDYIYISHIHPDHYDSRFLRQYFACFGEKPLLIASRKHNHLLHKMKSDGFNPVVLSDTLHIGSTSISIIPDHEESLHGIDSAIILHYQEGYRKHCVVNANDIVFTVDMRERLKASAGDIDIFLCGYTGAGPYPQTYFDTESSDMLKEATLKKQRFFERYRINTEHMDAAVNIPFAGKYLLGGKLIKLNQYRGVADPVEILAFDEKAVVLADNGGEISTIDLQASRQRTKAYSEAELNKRLLDIADVKMDYERLIAESEIEQLPIKRLLPLALSNARQKSAIKEDYYICIHLFDNECAVINCNTEAPLPISYQSSASILPQPRSEFFIDQRYLFGLLTHVYHWNNAEVGSQYVTRRYPDEFKPDIQSFLHFFAV